MSKSVAGSVSKSSSVPFLFSSAHAFIVIAGVFPQKRKLLLRTWDRTQLPRPFTTLHGRFGPPIDPRDYEGDPAGLRQRVYDELLALEQAWDPEEAAYAQPLEPAAAREA